MLSRHCTPHRDPYPNSTALQTFSTLYGPSTIPADDGINCAPEALPVSYVSILLCRCVLKFPDFLRLRHRDIFALATRQRHTDSPNGIGNFAPAVCLVMVIPTLFQACRSTESSHTSVNTPLTIHHQASDTTSTTRSCRRLFRSI